MKKKVQQKKNVAEYQIFLDKKLGGGFSGTVYAGLNKKTKEHVAIKMIPVQKVHGINQQYMINALKRQTLILSKISSENVVAFKDILATRSYYYIVQELCDKNLEKYLQENGKIPQKKAIEFMTMMLKGFFALIITNVIHRDIKPANILFKGDQLKLADFGLSRRVNGDQLMVSVVGTRSYSSPQIIGKTKYTAKADIWSLGVVFYQMLYGKLPFTKLSLEQLREDCQNFSFPMEPEVSQETQQIIKKCFQYNEEDRADWKYLFSHPLFAGNVPSLQKLNVRLNYIISVIRQEIDYNNIDLEKFFRRYGFQKDKEINYKQYERMIMKLIPVEKISKGDVQFSFNFFDGDKSGKISYNEFKKTLQDHGIDMNAASREQRIKNFVLDIKNQDDEGNILTDNQSFSIEEILLYSNTQSAYNKLMKGLSNQKIDDLQQKFLLADLCQNGLSLKQFTQFVRQQLQQNLSQKQCQLIFNKFDDDKNGSLAFEQFYNHVCKQLNVPLKLSFFEDPEKKQ